MSFFVYCLLLILYLNAANSRYIGVIDTELYDQKYQGLVGDHAVIGKIQKDSSKTTPSLSKNNEDTQGYEIISSSRVVWLEAAKLEKIKAQNRRTMLEPKSHDAEEPMDSKENDIDGVVEDVVVMDYAQPHRKTPIHNKDP